jgi:leucyl/phenylalanyl-tRNA--protein transferase
MSAAHSPKLSPELLLQAYCKGLFPMASRRRGGVIEWYSPDPRAILPLDAVRFSRNLLKRYRRGDYHLTHDGAFERVIRACAAPRSYAKETWINEDIIAAYTALHRMGFAHSVEAWASHKAGTVGPAPKGEDQTLVGGLYGIAIGRAFFGESMFSTATDASKVCLVYLVEHLRKQGFTLLDVQFNNDHMAQFGVAEIPREQYLGRLAEALRDMENKPSRF